MTFRIAKTISDEQAREVETTQGLSDFLSTFDLNSTLEKLSMTSAYLFSEGEPVDLTSDAPVTPWSLDFLMRLSILVCNTGEGKRFEKSDLCEAVIRYERLPDFIQLTTPEEHPAEAHRALLRISNLQFPYQEMRFLEFMRYLSIYDRFNMLLHESDHIDVESAIKELLSLDIHDLTRIGCVLLAYCHQHKQPMMSINQICSSEIPTLKYSISERHVGAFVDHFSGDITQLRSLISQGETPPPGFEKYALNELAEKPILRIDYQRFVVLSPFMLFESLTSGLWFRLSDHKGKQNQRGNLFREDFGKCFAIFVGDQLKSHEIGYDVLSEFSLKRAKSKLPDWYLVSENRGIAIECKSAALKREERTFADIEALKTDAVRNYLKGFKQITDFAELCHDHPTSIPLSHREKLCSVSEWYGLVVFCFPRYGGNGIWRNIFENSLPTFPGNLTEVQVVNIDEFEYFLLCAEIDDAVEILRGKRSIEETRSQEMGDYLKPKYQIPKSNPAFLQMARRLFGDEFFSRNRHAI